jgi:hypothetical protein
LGRGQQPRQPAHRPVGAAEGAQPGADAARHAAGLAGSDLACRNGRYNSEQRLLHIRCCTQRGDADPELLGRVDGTAGRRQRLRQERPQQPGLALDDRQRRLAVLPPSLKADRAPLRIGDAARPALRIAGTALGEAAAPVAGLARGRASRKERELSG